MNLFEKWFRTPPPKERDLATIKAAVREVLRSDAGAKLFAHLYHTVYGTVCYSHDPIALAVHNGRRSVLHELMELAVDHDVSVANTNEGGFPYA